MTALATAHRPVVVPVGHNGRFSGRCPCGYKGDHRITRSHAQEDADNHVRAACEPQDQPDEAHRLTGERRLYMGVDTNTVQRNLGKLRRLRAELEADCAAHPSRTNSICLAAVYSELAQLTLKAIPFDDDDQS